VDGELVGIEVTELVHQRAMERSLREQKQETQRQEKQDREPLTARWRGGVARGQSWLPPYRRRYDDNSAQ
jgi:hypothetical protein